MNPMQFFVGLSPTFGNHCPNLWTVPILFYSLESATLSYIVCVPSFMRILPKNQDRDSSQLQVEVKHKEEVRFILLSFVSAITEMPASAKATSATGFDMCVVAL